jgi:3',5'-cyclic AMP phosphodiesterase CpdA
MRIVHLTDLHYHSSVAWRRLLGKRALGVGNLVFRGRARRFGGAAREALVDDVLALRPDLVVLTGDVSTLATLDEFQEARLALQPLLDQLPVVMLAGNHDRYTHGARRTRRMESVFGPWMGGGRWDAASHVWADADVAGEPPVVFIIGHLRVVALDTAVPDLASRGRIGKGQLQRLSRLLGEGSSTGVATLLAVHYPLLTAQGEIYRHPTHGLVRVGELVRIIQRYPPLAVVHGHIHHWHVTGLPGESGGVVPVLNGGSSGLADLPGQDPGYLVLEADHGALCRLWRRQYVDGGYADQPLVVPS